MKIIYNNIIPFKGFLAITLYPFIFVRENLKEHFLEIEYNHESIHGELLKEMLLIFFYILYGLEWFIRYCMYGNGTFAYRMISFEQEAYNNEENMNYLSQRKHFAWIKYLFK